jgi:hypothetical protein
MALWELGVVGVVAVARDDCDLPFPDTRVCERRPWGREGRMKRSVRREEDVRVMCGG